MYLALKRSLLLAAVPVSLGLGGCEGTGLAQDVGGAIGSIAGQLLGQQVGISGLGNLGQKFGTVFGNEFEAMLNEQEQRRALEATERVIAKPAVGKGAGESWTSGQNPGVGGTAYVEREYKTADGMVCRVANNSARGPRGEAVAVRQDWCRQADGSWAPVVPAA